MKKESWSISSPKKAEWLITWNRSGWSKLDYVHSIERLSRVLKPVSVEQDADAAVALLLKHANEGFRILFVKRAENPVDPWSGQMAFPGGKRSSEDKNLRHTVVRETLEEINVNLLDRCRLLGVMTPLTSTQRPEMKILPFVVLLEHEPSIKLNNKELERFVWISIRDLFQNEKNVKFDFGEFPAYVVGDNIVWGLTYGILQNFGKLEARFKELHNTARREFV